MLAVGRSFRSKRFCWGRDAAIACDVRDMRIGRTQWRPGSQRGVSAWEHGLDDLFKMLDRSGLAAQSPGAPGHSDGDRGNEQ